MDNEKWIMDNEKRAETLHATPVQGFFAVFQP
jgi:hypothetical protein